MVTHAAIIASPERTHPRAGAGRNRSFPENAENPPARNGAGADEAGGEYLAVFCGFHFGSW